MVTYHDRIRCNDCSASVGNHKWGRIRAQADGWFFTMAGDAWCPLHVPQWVAEWRKRANGNARIDTQ